MMSTAQMMGQAERMRLVGVVLRMRQMMVLQMQWQMLMLLVLLVQGVQRMLLDHRIQTLLLQHPVPVGVHAIRRRRQTKITRSARRRRPTTLVLRRRRRRPTRRLGRAELRHVRGNAGRRLRRGGRRRRHRCRCRAAGAGSGRAQNVLDHEARPRRLVLIVMLVLVQHGRHRTVIGVGALRFGALMVQVLMRLRRKLGVLVVVVVVVWLRMVVHQMGDWGHRLGATRSRRGSRTATDREVVVVVQSRSCLPKRHTERCMRFCSCADAHSNSGCASAVQKRDN